MSVRGRLGVALLALAIALAGAPGLGRADAHDDQKGNPEAGQQRVAAQARPDLELSGGDFASPDNFRVIRFTVRNVGTAPSSATTMVRVVTSTPEPTPNFREIPLPPKTGVLKPGESGILKPGETAQVIYSLAADCNGHVVQALVSDPLDLNPANNAVNDKLVCVALPPPVVVGPAPNVIPIPEYLRPGSRNITLEPNYVYSSYRDHFFAGSARGCGREPYGSPVEDDVGWVQFEVVDDVFGIEYDRVCAYAGYAFLYVNFPYELLDGIQPEWINRAYLSFTEHQRIWRDNGGKTGCVTTLDFGPRVPYLSGPDSEVLFQGERMRDAVRELVSMEPVERIGWAFRLRGAWSGNDLRAEGSSSCMSRLDHIQLFVAYDVPN